MKLTIRHKIANKKKTNQFVTSRVLVFDNSGDEVVHTRSQRVEDNSVADISASWDGVKRSAQCAANYLELSAREPSSVVNLCV